MKTDSKGGVRLLDQYECSTPRPRGGGGAISCGKTGHSATRCPMLDLTFPFILPGWKAEKTSTGYLMISPKMVTDRRRAENED